MGELHLEVVGRQADSANHGVKVHRRQADGGLSPDAGQAGRDRDALHQAVGRPRQVRRHRHEVRAADQGADRGDAAELEEGRREAGPEQHLLRGRDLRRRRAEASTSRRSSRASATAAPKGAKYGFPFVDMQATLLDGKSHDVDSSADAFKLAAIECFRDAQVKAGIVLLEPIMNVVVHRARQVPGRAGRRHQPPPRRDPEHCRSTRAAA